MKILERRRKRGDGYGNTFKNNKDEQARDLAIKNAQENRNNAIQTKIINRNNKLKNLAKVS